MTSTTTPAPLLVSYREAGKLLDLCEKSIYNLVRAGKLPCIKIGRAARVSVADLQAFIDAQRQTGGGA